MTTRNRIKTALTLAAVAMAFLAFPATAREIPVEIRAFILYTADCVACRSTDYDVKWQIQDKRILATKGKGTKQ